MKVYFGIKFLKKILMVVCGVILFCGHTFAQDNSGGGAENENDTTAYSQEENTLLHKLADVKDDEKIGIYNHLAHTFILKNPVKARFYAQHALDIAQEIDNELGQAEAFKNIGAVYLQQSNLSQALAYFLDALKIFEQNKQRKGIAESLNNIGNIYFLQKKTKQAKEYYLKVLEMDKTAKNQKGVASTLNNLGAVAMQEEAYKDAEQYFEEALKINQRLHIHEGIAENLKNLGDIYHKKNNFSQALWHYFHSLHIDESIGNNANVGEAFLSIAETYLKSEKLDSALHYAKKSALIAEKYNFETLFAETSQLLSDIYAIQKNYEKAYYFQNLYLLNKEAFFDEKNSKKIQDLQTSYELEKQQQQITILQKDKKVKNIVLTAVLVCLALVFVLMMVFFHNNQQRKIINAQLRRKNEAILIKNVEITQQKEEILAQNEAIETQNEEIQRKNEEISKKSIHIESSIKYAQRIQQAMLPQEADIQLTFKDFFVYYVPRDVVSGDFYWFYKTKNKIIISANDCTGHGVPGAFMSMIGDSLLNQIVMDKGVLAPNEILDEMHAGIQKALSQSESKNRDGMDMMVCLIDIETKKIYYAGAKNSLLFVKNNEMHEYKADNLSVGGWNNIDRTNHKYEVQEIDYADSPVTLYLYSDGFQDQFGGKENKKFTRRQFRDFLFEIHTLPFAEQKQLAQQKFLDWKGAERQMDDVVVMGIKVEV